MLELLGLLGRESSLHKATSRAKILRSSSIKEKQKAGTRDKKSTKMYTRREERSGFSDVSKSVELAREMCVETRWRKCETLRRVRAMGDTRGKKGLGLGVETSRHRRIEGPKVNTRMQERKRKIKY